MNKRCYEYSQNSICLNSFDYVFIHKEVRCTKKANIKEGLQCSNKNYHYQVIQLDIYLRI